MKFSSRHHLNILSRQTAAGIRSGGRFSSFRGLKSIVTLFFSSQITVFLIAGLSLLVSRYIHDGIEGHTYISWVLEYWPFSWQEISQAFTWLCSANFLWTSLVVFNHWNDIVAMWATIPDTSIFGVFGALYAFWYVTCWSMGYEFFSTLFIDPSALFSTRAVLELMIGYQNVGYYIGVGVTFIGAHLPGVISPFYDQVVGFVTSGLSYITIKAALAVKSAWSFLVGGIATLVTPIVPSILQPIVNSIAVPVSKMIATMLLVWVLRIFFGFPF